MSKKKADDHIITAKKLLEEEESIFHAIPCMPRHFANKGKKSEFMSHLKEIGDIIGYTTQHEEDQHKKQIREQIRELYRIRALAKAYKSGEGIFAAIPALAVATFAAIIAIIAVVLNTGDGVCRCLQDSCEFQWESIILAILLVGLAAYSCISLCSMKKVAINLPHCEQIIEICDMLQMDLEKQKNNENKISVGGDAEVQSSESTATPENVGEGETSTME